MFVRGYVNVDFHFGEGMRAATMTMMMTGENEHKDLVINQETFPYLYHVLVIGKHSSKRLAFTRMSSEID